MVLRLLRHVVIAVLVSAAAVALISLSWRAIGGGGLPIHGWIALSLGVLGTVLMAWALMGLAFKSSREGWDDEIDNSRRTGGSGPDPEDSDRP